MSTTPPGRSAPDAGDPRPRTDVDWMELHLRCLHEHDANGRLLRTRQPDGGPSPLFHLGRTRLGNLWRFRADLAPAIVRELARLAGREPPLAPGHPPPERLEAMRSLLRSVGEVSSEWRGPAFCFPREIPREVPPRESRAAGGTGRDAPLLVEVVPGREYLLEPSFGDWIPELAARQPCFAVVEDGAAVSFCCAARPVAVAGASVCGAAEAGVETVAGHRGRGHAPRVVAAWARAVRARGGEPMYSTSWSNRASRAVAAKLGLHLYGEDLHLS